MVDEYEEELAKRSKERSREKRITGAEEKLVVLRSEETGRREKQRLGEKEIDGERTIIYEEFPGNSSSSKNIIDHQTTYHNRGIGVMAVVSIVSFVLGALLSVFLMQGFCQDIDRAISWNPIAAWRSLNAVAWNPILSILAPEATAGAKAAAAAVSTAGVSAGITIAYTAWTGDKRMLAVALGSVAMGQGLVPAQQQYTEKLREDVRSERRASGRNLIRIVGKEEEETPRRRKEFGDRFERARQPRLSIRDVSGAGGSSEVIRVMRREEKMTPKRMIALPRMAARSPETPEPVYAIERAGGQERDMDRDLYCERSFGRPRMIEF